MNYRPFGLTGLKISILGMGTMRLPAGRKSSGRSGAIDLLLHAMRRHINFFDIAEFYAGGQCESILGEALKLAWPPNLILAAKNNAHQTSDPDWSRHLTSTLSNLQCDHLDYYFLHFLQYQNWQDYYLDKGVLEEVLAAQKKGLFRHLGFSSHDTPGRVRLMIDTGVFSAIILPYNLINRSYEEVLRYAADCGLGVIAMNPMAGGALAKSALFAEAFQGLSSEQLASLALNYVLSQPFIHCAISGMESAAIINGNIDTVHRPRFSAEEIEQLDDAISRENAERYIPCTGCQYCLPCPQGIPIPEIINMLNQFAGLQGENLNHREYRLLQNPAECCITCGACAVKCPQGLPIPQLMMSAAKRFTS